MTFDNTVLCIGGRASSVRQSNFGEQEQPDTSVPTKRIAPGDVVVLSRWDVVNMEPLSENMQIGEKMRNRLITLSVIFLLIIVFGYLNGYRFDGLSAARANGFVPQDSILMDQVDYNWGSVYIFDSKEKPITAISFKKVGFFWVSKVSIYYFHSEDPIKTIGGISLGNEREKATVISVVVNDPNVSYLEVGPEKDKQKKEVTLGKPITFSWYTPFQWNDLDPRAFSKEGKLLYEYRYAKSNYIKIEDLKWYPTDIEN